jgi:hypothetical protein
MILLLVVAERASPDAKRGLLVPRVFGAAAAEYLRKHGDGVEHLAKIGGCWFLCGVCDGP